MKILAEVFTSRRALLTGAAVAVASAPRAYAAAHPTPGTEFAFEAIVELAPAQKAGVTPFGDRNRIPITGGVFEGPRIKGKVLSGGDDWQLIPYTYALSWDVTHRGGTMMRPLVMDLRDDAYVASIGDEYTFGKGLLVAPVIDKGAKSRAVYLPGQTSWYNFWTGERINAGQTVTAKAELETIPLFLQAGSILPLGPAIQYADERSSEPMELRIYLGSDGYFELYDDEGDGYGYQKGRHATIDLRWNDAKQELSIGKHQGKFPGMPQKISFKAVCGAGGKTGQSPVVIYTGAARTISLPGCR